MTYKDARPFWWLLTSNSHQIHFYGSGERPSDDRTGNSTGVVEAKYGDGSIWAKTQSGSVYRLDWARHRPNLANMLADKAFLVGLGVKFPNDDWT